MLKSCYRSVRKYYYRVRVLHRNINLHDISKMISTYEVLENSIISGPGDIEIASNWADLLDGNLLNSLYDAEVITDSETGWWSGSQIDGTYDNTVDNCNGWTSTAGKGIAGSPDSSQSEWIQLNSPNCSASRHVLCVTW